MTELKPLPVAGYTNQSADKVALVNRFKEIEERILREIDALVDAETEDREPIYDRRWASIARSHIQEGFMALNRSVFQPQRINLPEDDNAHQG